MGGLKVTSETRGGYNRTLASPLLVAGVGEERFARPSMRCVPVVCGVCQLDGVCRRCVPARWCVPVVCASSMVCAGGVCQLCAAARSRRLLIKQAVLPPNPDQTTRARCCRLVLGAYLANFSGFFFALFFFSRPLLLDTPKADKAMRLGVLESGLP